MLIFTQSCQTHRRAVYITHSALITIFTEKHGKRALRPFRKCQRECWIYLHLNAKFKNPVTAASQKNIVIVSREARNLEWLCWRGPAENYQTGCNILYLLYEECIIIGCNAIRFGGTWHLSSRSEGKPSKKPSEVGRMAELALQLWRWKWCVPPKCRHLCRLHGVTTQKIAFCTSVYLLE